MEPYRILLAEDHLLFREFLKKSLGEISGIKVVGEVGDGLQLLKLIEEIKPQMVILDIEMPILSGLEAARTIKKAYPEIKILLLTMYKDKDHFIMALKAKVDGYLLKENLFKDLITAIEMIRNGNLYISDILSRKMVEYIVHGTWSKSLDLENLPGKEAERGESVVVKNLSQREIEVLTYFAQGKSLKEISEILDISWSTVRNHIAKIKKKLGIKKNIDLIKYALKQGYASIFS
jgi:DNA-binding NarL/FixJ family response regulator